MAVIRFTVFSSLNFVKFVVVERLKKKKEEGEEEEEEEDPVLVEAAAGVFGCESSVVLFC